VKRKKKTRKGDPVANNDRHSVGTVSVVLTLRRDKGLLGGKTGMLWKARGG